MEARMPDADVGVIIGRFQVPDLHEGHIDLVETVRRRHKKVLILICSTPGVLVTRKNPLDYYTRMLMMRAAFPDVEIQPLHDTPSDEDWSRAVDKKIVETFNDHVTAVLYGSRDAFIPYYTTTKNFLTVELADSVDISGTKVREAASAEVREHSEFRRGVVYAAHNKHPATFPTVDVGVIKYNEGKPEAIALGRKDTDPKNKWRFPGGFVDPKRDDTFEQAARREAIEELGPEITDLTYIGSHKINDWRYRNEIDQIITTLFIAKYQWGPLQASDDLDDAKWFPLKDFDLDVLIDGHQILMQMILTYLKRG